MKLLLSFVVFIFAFSIYAFPSDSIGVRAKGGRSYILHKVDAGETLYALSKRYKASVSSIESANGIDAGLSVGQVLWVPTTATVEQPTVDVKFHTVEPGQTLYAISRLHNVSVDNIKKWNNLSSNELSVGQKIIVAQEVKIISTVVPVEESIEVKKVQPEKESTLTEKEPINKKEQVVKQSKTSYNPQKQVGKVVLGSDVRLNHKFSYCLHPSAPIGTIMVLTCKFNDRVILVKVVGNLSMDSGIILNVNKSVLDSLNIDNNSFEAEVTYLD